MLYSFYEMNQLAMLPLRAAIRAQSALLRAPFNPAAQTQIGKTVAAAGEVFESLTRRYAKPEWRLTSTRVNGIDVAVTPQPVWSTPWCDLIHFARDPVELEKIPGRRKDKKVLIVAPLSGHYATLLHGTVEAFLPEHDVYITDWVDARMVPVVAGRFDMNDYIDHIIDILGFLGGGAHVVAVCQPGPPVLAAISRMAEDKDPALPSTMTYMGSPIDARKSPTAPNKLAEGHDLDWFKRRMIHTVPPMYPGAFRRVYPGFLQLASFMGMNLDRHVDAHWDFFKSLTQGDGESVQKHREFYEEYLSVLDLSEEFYLQTIRDVFQEYKLPRGLLKHRGRLIRPELIQDVGLMTVEGEKDDISGVGQTQAAHDICSSIPDHMRILYVQAGVGHYGVFNGRRYRTDIYPRIREFIRTFDRSAVHRLDPHAARNAAPVRRNMHNA